MITPESSWEKDWKSYEEDYMERPKKDKPLKKCEDCLPEFACYKLPFITNVRLVNFPEFNNRTFVEGSIENCPWKKPT